MLLCILEVIRELNGILLFIFYLSPFLVITLVI